MITLRVNSLIMDAMMMVDVHTTQRFAAGFFLSIRAFKGDRRLPPDCHIEERHRNLADLSPSSPYSDVESLQPPLAPSARHGDCHSLDYGSSHFV